MEVATVLVAKPDCAVVLHRHLLGMRAQMSRWRSS